MKAYAWAAKQRAAALEPFRYDIADPQDQSCVIKVRACGICHSDVHMIDNDWGFSQYPLVPGHEAVGEVVEVGPHVRHLKPGDRVGVGWQASACMVCPACLRGDENLCEHNVALLGLGRGSFADHVAVDSRFAFRIPDGIDTNVAGPLLCGGVTVYSALRRAGMTSGQNIGVIGVGGLGHMAVRFASRMGNLVTVFTTSDDKAESAATLGAHEAIVTKVGQELKKPRRKLDILINTAPHLLDWGAYLDTLAPSGTIVVVAAAGPITLPPMPLMSRGLRVMGSVIGGRAVMTEMLEVADRFGIQPVVETFPMDAVNTALARVRSNDVRFRAVLLAV